ncbi:hypothetical protein IAG44_12705 [Streptomyces roseirectus]|uniref:Uncharacterized protein n=1 Tax=Streptomyces roseirectus TaxID=2768066 RepID=A0A7H0IBQ7_9ACTN|nr:DUF6193 family natural product biosynthesis protein [Streptomyces roseirectus]QNP70223.1 hypothetical protein IAG44_12705 [Streptomyces roseirectus]
MNALDSALYPDLFAAGGLIAAMELASEKKNLDLGRLYSHYASEPGRLVTAGLDSSRGRASVQLGSQSRTFYVAIRGDGFTWAEGATDDLGDLIEALAAWRDGISIGDFVEKFHFMTPGRLARIRESGDPVPAQWNWLRTAEEFHDERSLVEAFYADGRFNRFFPILSHGALRLRSVGLQQKAREVSVTPLSGGSYRVENLRLLDSAFPESLKKALDVASEVLVSDE